MLYIGLTLGQMHELSKTQQIFVDSQIYVTSFFMTGVW